MTKALSDAQQAWLKEHPDYVLVGPPRVGSWYVDCGTLYADGKFILHRQGNAVELKEGCKMVGIRHT